MTSTGASPDLTWTQSGWLHAERPTPSEYIDPAVGPRRCTEREEPLGPKNGLDEACEVVSCESFGDERTHTVGRELLDIDQEGLVVDVCDHEVRGGPNLTCRAGVPTRVDYRGKASRSTIAFDLAYREEGAQRVQEVLSDCRARHEE